MVISFRGLLRAIFLKMPQLVAVEAFLGLISKILVKGVIEDYISSILTPFLPSVLAYFGGGFGSDSFGSSFGVSGTSVSTTISSTSVYGRNILREAI